MLTFHVGKYIGGGTVAQQVVFLLHNSRVPGSIPSSDYRPSGVFCALTASVRLSSKFSGVLFPPEAVPVGELATLNGS